MLERLDEGVSNYNMFPKTYALGKTIRVHGHVDGCGGILSVSKPKADLVCLSRASVRAGERGCASARAAVWVSLSAPSIRC